jgi:hypothetical protein
MDRIRRSADVCEVKSLVVETLMDLLDVSESNWMGIAEATLKDTFHIITNASRVRLPLSAPRLAMPPIVG